jgi:hypothetical protein
MSILNLFFEGSDFASEFFKENVIHRESSINDCDFIISSSFKFGIVDQIEIQNKLDKYHGSSKTVIVFLCSDYSGFLDIPAKVILFRTSIYKSIQQDNEFLLPYLWESFDESFTELPKTARPIIGFCGNVKNNSGYRQSCINRLESNAAIETNFIGRDGFWGGKPNDAEYSLEFKKNILASHFTLSNRGKGNFSIRFYQVLSLGRIPALVDTDMVFPFEKEIAWDQYIIRASTEKDLIKKMKQWWETKDNSEIIAIEKKCKEIFDYYFSLSSYGSRIFEFLIAIKNSEIVVEKNRNTKKKLFNLPELNYKINKHINLIKSKF